MSLPSRFFLPLTSLLLLISCLSCRNPPSTPDVTATPPEETVMSIEIPPPSPSNEDIAASAQLRQEGLTLRNQGQWEQAIARLSESVQLNPTHVMGHVILGWTYHLAGQETEAVAALQQALEQDANFVAALNALGIVYLVKGDLDQAVETHQRAITLQSDNEIAHYNLSLAYHRLQQYKQAIAHGKTATQLEPGNPHPWVALALAYWSAGDQGQAKKMYRRAITLDGGYRSSGHLAHLAQAGFSEEQIQLTEQIRLH